MIRWAPYLERGALVVALTGVALRWGVTPGTAGTGFNLFIHMLPVMALAAWFAARALAGGTVWRFNGIEFVVLGLTIVEFVSAYRASHRLPALELALGHLAFGLFAILALQALGGEGLSRLLLTGLFTASVLALLQVTIIFPMTADRVASEAVEIRNRHATFEPFAGFTGPNQLAAFLVLTLPLALGALLDARSAGLRGMIAPSLAFALGAVVLFTTGSLGGWVSASVGAVAFAALALTRRRGRRVAVVLGAAAAAGVLALALFSPLLQRAAEKSHSLHVRRAYWSGAARLIAERPLAGVGLGNFEDHYPRVKGDIQQEVTLVHNDYLQVLAETGLLGFAVFAALLGLGLRRASARDAEPAAGPEAPRAWPLTAAGLVAFLLLTLRIRDPFLLAGGAAWALFAWLSGGSKDAGPWSRVGAAAGFLGFLVQMTVEFLWVEPGTALALYAGVALLLAFAPKVVDVRLSTKACAAAAGVLALVAAPLFILSGPALAADRELAEAQAAFKSRDPAAAAALAEAAQGHNPLLDAPYVIYAAATFALAGDDPVRAEAALQALDNAIAVRPDHASHRVSAAQLNFALHQRLKRQEGNVARVRAEAHLARAIAHQEKAVALYPSQAQGRYDLGRMLDLLGRTEPAAAEYAEALRLSDLASREVEKRSDLQLQGIRRIRALARTGRSPEAAREAKRLLPLGGEGDTRKILETLRADPKLLVEDPGEIDEVTRPLIEAAIDEVLR